MSLYASSVTLRTVPGGHQTCLVSAGIGSCPNVMANGLMLAGTSSKTGVRLCICLSIHSFNFYFVLFCFRVAGEAHVFGTMLVAYGYIYPLQNHKKLVMSNDTSLYRFQVKPPFTLCVLLFSAIYLAKRNIRKKGMLEPYEQVHYNHLHEWLNHKWDFIVMQATEQYKAGKERKKADRVVFDCQERAYWIVNRPPHFVHTVVQYAGLRNPDIEALWPPLVLLLCLCRLVKYITTYKNHDAFLAPCLPSNPWQTDNDSYWTLNMRRVDVPTKMRVERWSFSLFELLSDLRGRDDFKIFLKKEFSGENLAFWEAAEELKWGTASSMSTKAETIFKTFLAPGAPRWINIDGRTMGLTVKGLEHPHRYVLEAAQTHVFLLMKKDTFFRYLKSPVYKDIQKKARNPEPHNFRLFNSNLSKPAGAKFSEPRCGHSSNHPLAAGGGGESKGCCCLCSSRCQGHDEQNRQEEVKSNTVALDIMRHIKYQHK
uniref:Regulator of G protein signaling 9a n=1 Tax=Echeneis naucrates TaxID=173247 RepID=A0A665TZX3_ECHNA